MKYNMANFNWKHYLYLNQDLISAGIRDEGSAAQHFYDYGINEGRQYRLITPADFNHLFYKKHNKLTKKLRDKDGIYAHYSRIGRYRNLLYSVNSLKKSIDYEFYKEYYKLNDSLSNRDILKSHINNGHAEGRYIHPCILFDNFDYGFYISYLNNKTNTDSCMYSEYEALQHYLLHKGPVSIRNIVYPAHIKNIDYNNSACVYAIHISNKQDILMIKETLHFLKKVFGHIFLVISSEIGVGLESIYIDSNFNNIKTFYVSNIGWDFYKYAFGISRLLETNIDPPYVCLINNSVTIKKDISTIINNFISSNSMAYGLTDSYERCHNILECVYHLQSYFLLIDKSIVSGVRDFILSKMPILEKNNRHSVIEHCEIGLSKWFIKNNIPISTYLSVNDVKENYWSNIFNINLSMDVSLLNKLDIPIVKKIHKNHYDYFAYKLKLPCVNNTSIITHSNFNKASILKHKYSIDIFVHIGNKKFESIMIDYINKIKKIKHNINFIITSNEKLETINTIIVENRGADIGPFIKHFSSGHSDYFIKIHSKTNHAWRERCINNLIDNIDLYIKSSIESNVSVGGCYGYSMNIDSLNDPIMEKFIKQNKFKTNLSKLKNNTKFLAGTMFFGKTSTFRSFFDMLDMNYEYSLLETGYRKNDKPTNTHNWERILTGVVPFITKTEQFLI